MKYAFFIVMSVLLCACADSHSNINDQEYLQYRRSKEVMVGQFEDIDSADINVQHIKTTRFFFKSTTSNKLLFTLFIKKDKTIDTMFVENQIKSLKYLAEKEISNYFNYDGAVFDFYQKGLKIASHEDGLE